MMICTTCTRLLGYLVNMAEKPPLAMQHRGVSGRPGRHSAPGVPVAGDDVQDAQEAVDTVPRDHFLHHTLLPVLRHREGSGGLTTAVPTLPTGIPPPDHTPGSRPHHPVITDIPIPAPTKSLTGIHFLGITNCDC